MYDTGYILIMYSYYFFFSCHIVGLQILVHIPHHSPHIIDLIVLIAPTLTKGIMIIMVVIIHRITGLMNEMEYDGDQEGRAQ